MAYPRRTPVNPASFEKDVVSRATSFAPCNHRTLQQLVDPSLDRSPFARRRVVPTCSSGLALTSPRQHRLRPRQLSS